MLTSSLGTTHRFLLLLLPQYSQSWLPFCRLLEFHNPQYLETIPGYRSNYYGANPQDQAGRSPFYRGVHCHNYREEGHYSTSCTKPVVSGAQREANRRAIDELQGRSSSIPSRTRYGTGPAASPICPGSSGPVVELKDNSKVVGE